MGYNVDFGNNFPQEIRVGSIILRYKGKKCPVPFGKVLVANALESIEDNLLKGISCRNAAECRNLLLRVTCGFSFHCKYPPSKAPFLRPRVGDLRYIEMGSDEEEDA